MTRIDDPKLVLRELLGAEWGAGGIDAGLTVPDISTGWHNEGLDEPQVTCGPDRAEPAVATRTGMTHFKADGSGGVTDMDGVCQVHTWCDKDEEGDGENAKELAFEYAMEVREIVKQHVEISEYTFPDEADVTAEHYRWVWPAPHRFVPDADVRPVNFHYVVEVGFGYIDE